MEKRLSIESEPFDCLIGVTPLIGVAGDLLSTGNQWTTTQALGTATLTAGQDYFLHIYALNWIGPAGFLGDFSLSGGGHEFANGNTFLTTNTTNWMVNAVGWGASNFSPTSYGTNNGNNPTWPAMADVDSAAEWIWLPYVENFQAAYFTTKISAVNGVVVNGVSEPPAALLLAVGLVALGLRRKVTA